MNEPSEKIDPIKHKEFHEGLELLERKLNEYGLKYLKYLDKKEVVGTNVPSTLKYASKPDSHIDAIIFKVGPATGWDIPRANMLLQLRSVSSEALNMQTLGRIMRNPYPDLKFNSITNKYYLYSNFQKPSRETATYKLKSKFIDKKFFQGRIDENSRIVQENLEEYRKDVLNYLDSKEFKNKIKYLSIDEVIYDSQSYGNTIIKNKIPNYILLKIYNIKKYIEFNKQFNLSLFNEKLLEISNTLNKNIEIIKYLFFSILNTKINELKIKNLTWQKDEEPYNIKKNGETLGLYQIWKDNKNPKKVNTKEFNNYGYLQIEEDENIQFLDSEPEMKFYQKFSEFIPSNKREEIKFFAKMPTLGSKVFFEYYSKKQGKIVKSFMDFAIEYKNKIIMVEVKSYDSDYDEEKTNELLEAYEIYMRKYKEKNIELVLYQYDKKNSNHHLNYFKEDKWKTNEGFADLIYYLFE